jgi:transposase
MFSYVCLEERVPWDHPLRGVRNLTDVALRSLSAELDALYADSGRPSIAPEHILRALLLQGFYSVRSEQLLVELIDYDLLFRWFVGLGSGRCGEPRRADRRRDGDPCRWI